KVLQHSTPPQRTQRPTTHLKFYNTQRRHSALSGLPPISRL
ncbi:IS481 family transposase, partial [Mycobacterium palustre]|nr:IS481 family transposase [Mycobacterium palustre]